ncbi:MAG: hypothetical protein WBQ95_13545 [Terracidiphilus sp.]
MGRLEAAADLLRGILLLVFSAFARTFEPKAINEMLPKRITASFLAIVAQDFGQEDDITLPTGARLATAVAGLTAKLSFRLSWLA